jgi:hypothetical protein
MKKIITLLSIIVAWITTFTVAQVWFEVIPESESSASNIGSTVDSIRVGGSVWEKYKDTAYWPKNASWGRTWNSDFTLGDQFASGIMTWDTILDYAVYLAKFIWQLALLVWAVMIIYYGYKKATEHIKFSWTIWKVVIWILIISFAYVIVKIIRSMFIS